MALRRFALQAAAGFRGRDAGVEFARALLASFGVDTDAPPEGLAFGYPRWFSTDCIESPPLPGLEDDAEDA